jgi:hypothetical protein
MASRSARTAASAADDRVSSSGNYQPFVTAFKEGLKQTDNVEGRNVAIEYR